MAGLQAPGVAAAGPKVHLSDVNPDNNEKRPIMTALKSSMRLMGDALGVVGAAISSAAALRITRRPEGAVRFPETDHSVRI